MKLAHPTLPVRGLRRFAVLALCALSATAVCASALAWRVEIHPIVSAENGPAQEQTAKPKRILVSSGRMAENVLSKVQPVYPEEAKKAGIQGTVELIATINKEGVVENLQVHSGPKELHRSALDAVRQWKYKPFLLNGEPVEVETTVNVIYSLGK